MVGKKEQNMFRSLIEKAEDELQQIEVCQIAAETLANHSHPADFLEWFLKEADRQWFKTEKSDDQKTSELSDILSMIKAPSEANEELKSEIAERTIQEDDVYLYRARYTDLIRGIIGAFSNCGLSVGAYYDKLWTILCSIIKNNKGCLEMGVCLYIILSDPRTPYYSVKPGLRMPNERYREVIEEIRPTLEKMNYVLLLNNSQKTETASQLLNILDSIEGKENRVVFMSQVLTSYSRMMMADSGIGSTPNGRVRN